MSAYVIGTVTIGEGRVYNPPQEVAAWHEDIAVTPGTYDVSVATSPGNSAALTARVHGVTTSAYYPSLYGGVAFGSEPQGVNSRKVGNEHDNICLRVSFDEVLLNAEASKVMCWRWLEDTRAGRHKGDHGAYKDPSPVGLHVESWKMLALIEHMHGCEYRIDPNDGGIAEFTDSEHTLALRVNELIDAGYDCDVWRVAYTGETPARPWFETPYEDHRGLYNRKFPLSYKYGEERAHWRYYQPDYQPR